MDLGQKLKAARLELNLSQRQLCEGIVTRNMLSQIENGAAQPSMDTLRQFAARLQKSVSYFLEDEAVTSPNQNIMESARNHFKSAEFSAVFGDLEDYHSPDPVFDAEYHLLLALSRMEQARMAMDENRLPYFAAHLSDEQKQALTGAGMIVITLGDGEYNTTGDLAEDVREVLMKSENILEI